MQAPVMANIELQTRCVIIWQLPPLIRLSETVGGYMGLDKLCYEIMEYRCRMNENGYTTRHAFIIIRLTILDIMKSIKHKSDFGFSTARPP